MRRREEKGVIGIKSGIKMAGSGLFFWLDCEMSLIRPSKMQLITCLSLPPIAAGSLGFSPPTHTYTIKHLYLTLIIYPDQVGWMK